jgi:hypothetical protein
MKRRVIEMLNLQKDSFSNRETKVRWVDWENKNVSHGQEPFDQKQGGFDMKHKLPVKLTIQSMYMSALKLMEDKGWKINLNERKVDKFPHHYNAAFPTHFPGIREEARL